MYQQGWSPPQDLSSGTSQASCRRRRVKFQAKLDDEKSSMRGHSRRCTGEEAASSGAATRRYKCGMGWMLLYGYYTLQLVNELSCFGHKTWPENAVRSYTRLTTPFFSSSSCLRSRCLLRLHVKVSTCRFRASFRANPLWHKGHMFGGTLRWIFSCRLRSDDRLNEIPQFEHL